MKLATKLTELTRRMNTAARMLEHPPLFKLMRAGGSPRLFLDLNLPWLHALNIRTILDIGANRGQFALTMEALFPNARIIAFEPLPELHAALSRHAQATPRFQAIQCGLGESNGEMTFNKLALDASSSFLKPNAVLQTHAPEITAFQGVTVPVRRLDDVMTEHAIEDALFIKLDVQGFEDRVIRGGEATFRRAALLLVETSTIPLYEGAPVFADLLAQLTALGFEYAGTLERLVTLQDGQIASEDTLFVRRARTDRP